MILVFGKTGQVATELRSLLPDATFLGREDADLTDPVACATKITELKPAAVINAAAYTAVDKAETEVEAATLVNATTPAALAKACADLGIAFVHISTDYVFDGTGETGFKPNDPTGPLGVYGASKLAGEDGIRATGGTFAIMRTSWVFSAHGANFMKTMLRLGAERDKLTIVADQIGAPTPARAIAAACVTLAQKLTAEPALSGTYHFAGDKDVSWADFARAIFDAAGITCDVEDIPTSAYPTPAARPQNSRMDCTNLQNTFGIGRPDWRAAIKDTIKELEN